MDERFVHIDVLVDMTNPEQLSALYSFLSKVGKDVKTLADPEPEKPVRTGKPGRPPKQAKTEPEPQPEPQPEPEPEPQPEPKVEEKTYQVEEVREKLKEKVSDHREEIKAKLTELGAPNVSSLDPSKYTEFVNFLESLE